jgi:hypothetical protein
LVEIGRKELLADRETSYAAFCDLSGGRNDDAALAVAHREGRKVILDLLRVWRAPFNPYSVIEEMADELKRNWKLKRITGDFYGAEFTASAFNGCGVRYTRSEKPKSRLYLELMPILCSGEIELLDDERLISQLAGLERRTRSGGHDLIDHPPGGHDDMANVVAGVSVCLARPTKIVGRPLTAPARFEFSDPLAHYSEPLLDL